MSNLDARWKYATREIELKNDRGEHITLHLKEAEWIAKQLPEFRQMCDNQDEAFPGWQQVLTTKPIAEA